MTSKDISKCNFIVFINVDKHLILAELFADIHYNEDDEPIEILKAKEVDNLSNGRNYKGRPSFKVHPTMILEQYINFNNLDEDNLHLKYAEYFI